jgi:hypothetical protein
MLLFAAVALLAAALSLALWRRDRRAAIVAASLTGLAALCILNESVARARGANIRVDLLLLIPLVTASALVVGAMNVRRPQPAARVIASGLVLVGGAAFTWFAWRMVLSTFEGRRLTRTFDQGRKLYWEETIRCQGNLARRFGPLDRAAEPCRGNLVVTSRTPKSYPFSRAVLNDAGQFYLLFSPDNGPEQTWGLDSFERDHEAATLQNTSDNTLAGEGTKDGQPVRVVLRGISGGCEATITRAADTHVLTLAKSNLPACAETATPPVHFAGAWGTAAPYPGSPQTRRLVEIWLWEIGDTARGLLLDDLAASGMDRPFVFARHLQGSRRAAGQWDLRVVNRETNQKAEAFTLTLGDGRATVAGSTILFGPSNQMLLEPREIVSHPKIALIPLFDRDRFTLYFDNVFFNLNVPWTVP